MKIKEFDTIAAIATSFGEGGIGIIRVSGEDAFNIAQKIFKPFAQNKKEKQIKDYDSHTLTYGTIQDNGEIIDEVLLSVMKAPKTYTCEDVIEINCHGGNNSVKRILHTVLKNGARIAENGEFTKRAFLNGRIDLSKAEAVIDIISSKTELAHKSAVSRLGGKLNEKISEYRNDIITMTAHIEAAIDYPEHDDEAMTYQTIEENTKKLVEKINTLLKTADTGRIVKEGIKTVILGKPNVGKSSILNFLLDEERAIVSDIAGTTRDVLKEHLNINGIALNIIDTAGIRNTEDEIEKIGVLKSKEYAKDADLILLVLDNSRKIDEEDIEILEFIKNKKVIVLINKIDLENKLEENKIYDYVSKEN
ncbi:MAG: tRNA uridine-5-carboxymethylaminomethyl(34) synthesis GTPase MnmE, partial [Eubacteriales bacterium]|nr:tRNA uridine-5-carboxymethylaminomethyl(34) synthesis GTPase MnmE [Eubacteriales bacterium]